MRRFLILLVLCYSHAANAGAWLMPEGDGLALVQLTHFTGDRYWDAFGERQPQARFTKFELQPYLEYGLTKKITVGGSAYLQYDHQNGLSNKGIADPEIFARALLWKGKSRLVSLQPLIKFPSSFEHDNGTPRGGSQSMDAELSLLYGQNLKLLSDRDYADLRIGYRERSGHLNGQFKADAAIGVSPFERWQLIPAVRLVQAAQIDESTAFRQDGELDYTLVKAELTVAYELPGGRWVQATLFDHLSGMQTGDGRGVSLGYAMRF